MKPGVDRDLSVTIREPIKSIEPTEEFRLHGFSIIVGSNGSGKSHLLEALSDSSYSTIRWRGRTLTNRSLVRFGQFQAAASDSGADNADTQFLDQVWRVYDSFRMTHRKNRDQPHIQALLMQQFGEKNQRGFMERVASNTSKDLFSLSFSDLQSEFDFRELGMDDFFKTNLTMLFASYEKARLAHLFRGFLRNREGGKGSIEDADKEFAKKFGPPPWRTLDEYFELLGLPFECVPPPSDTLNLRYRFSIRHQKSGIEMGPKELSNGERLLVSLALLLFGRESNVAKPDLILMDEPDLGLHPSAVRILIRTLKSEVFDREAIPFVITTHSPVLVSLAQESIVYLKNHDSTAPQPVDMAGGLASLQEGVPLLEVSTNNKRVVFVESVYDAELYDRLFSIYNEPTEDTVFLKFVPAGSLKGGNCEDVKRLVSSLRANGLWSQGIIDFDGKNTPDSGIFILGNGERYSIENYLLDPLLVGVLLIRQNAELAEALLGQSYCSFSSIREQKQEWGQSLSNRIMEIFEFTDPERKESRRLNGWSIGVGSQVFSMRGHDLESLIKSKIPYFRAYSNEPMLKRAVVEQVLREVPGMVPVELVDTLFGLSAS